MKMTGWCYAWIGICVGAAAAQAAETACNSGTIDNHSKVDYVCDGDFFLRGKIDNNSRVHIAAKGMIHILGKIDNLSTVSLESKEGAILIDEKIDGGSKACLNAPKGHIDINLINGSNPQTVVYWQAANTPNTGTVDGGVVFQKKACPWQDIP